MDFKAADFLYHKKVLVFGLGILGGGEGVVKTLAKLGAHIRITDLKNKQQLAEVLAKFKDLKIDGMTLGKHKKEDIDWAEIIIKNPDVPSSHKLIQYAFKSKKHVTTQAALFLKLTKSKTIGITGTRGKTTTTMMIYQTLSKNLTRQVLLGGNIKNLAALPLLLKEEENSISVLELSSWELEGCDWEKISPQISVITNLYEDHLNRYDQEMKKYATAKLAITKYQKQTDQLFINKNFKWLDFFTSKTHAKVTLVDKSSLPKIINLKIPGQHNRFNAAFAYEIAKYFQISEKNIAASLKKFKGVEHRQQLVGKKKGLTFINDSTSTTPEALIAALETFPQSTFIIGGTTKKLSMVKLAQRLSKFTGQLVWLDGSGTRELLKLMPEIQPKIHADLKSAFQEAVELTQPPAKVVFSPGFSSFQMFNNEFHRAQTFDDLVKHFS